MDADIRLGSYSDVLCDVRPNLIFTSPPYNIGSKAPRRDGFRRQGKFDPKSYGAITDYPDSLPEDEYQDQQAEFFLWAGERLAEGGILVYNHKPRRVNGAMIHPAIWFLRPEVQRVLTLMEEVIWDRGSTHNHSDRLMWPQTERLYVFRRADDRYSFQSHSELPFRSDVWRIANGHHAARKTGHNAPFATALAEGVVRAWSKPGDMVCDPYTGSGTTAVAALALGRRFVGSELMPKYHRIATERVSLAQLEMEASR